MAGLLPDNVHPQRSKYFQLYTETPDEKGEKQKVKKDEEKKEQARTQKQAPAVRLPDAVTEPKPIATVQSRIYSIEDHRRGVLRLGTTLKADSLVMAKTGGRGTMVQPSSHIASHKGFTFSANEVLVIDRGSHTSSRESSIRDDTVTFINRKGDIDDIPRDLVGTALLGQSSTVAKAKQHIDKGTEAKVDPTETAANRSAELPGILGVLAQPQHKLRRSESQSAVRRQQGKQAKRSSRFDPYARG